MKKSYIIMITITTISIILTIVLGILMNHMDMHYEEVKATVISVETKTKVRHKYIIHTDYNVKIMYEGDTYELKNVHDTYSYAKGKQIVAYLSNGNLYANVEGIKGDTPLAKVYFVFVFISWILMIATSVYIISSRKRRA